MTDRRIVTEVKATAAVRVTLPVESEGSVETALTSALTDDTGIRAAVVEELGDVTPTDDELGIDAYVRVTVHLDTAATDPAERARALLEDATAVERVRAFTVRDGPYRIEAW